jgi:hypothetical protein
MKEKTNEAISKLWKILVGLILIVVGVGTYWWFWPQLIILIKGGLGLVIAFVGLMFLLVGATE